MASKLHRALYKGVLRSIARLECSTSRVEVVPFAHQGQPMPTVSAARLLFRSDLVEAELFTKAQQMMHVANQLAAAVGANALSELDDSPPDRTILRIGTPFTHRVHGRRGVIIGYDASFSGTESMASLLRIDELANGRQQPFYYVLTDVRDLPEGGVHYVAHDNVNVVTPSTTTAPPDTSRRHPPRYDEASLTSDACFIAHPHIKAYFEEFVPMLGVFLPNSRVGALYPRDAEYAEDVRTALRGASAGAAATGSRVVG